jgi:hypothetical protein
VARSCAAAKRTDQSADGWLVRQKQTSTAAEKATERTHAGSGKASIFAGRERTRSCTHERHP